jgi:hypothetical protein
MRRPTLTRPGAYGFAVASVAVCTLARWLLNPLLENQGLYLAFMIPVAWSAYIGGRGPGAVSAVLSAAFANPLLFQFPVPAERASTYRSQASRWATCSCRRSRSGSVELRPRAAISHLVIASSEWSGVRIPCLANTTTARKSGRSTFRDSVRSNPSYSPCPVTPSKPIPRVLARRGAHVKRHRPTAGESRALPRTLRSQPIGPSVCWLHLDESTT